MLRSSLSVIFKPFKLRTSQMSSKPQKFEHPTFHLSFWFCLDALMDELLEWGRSCVKTRTWGSIAADVYREHETVLHNEPSHVLDLTADVSAVESSCLPRFWRVPDLFLMCLMHEVKSVEIIFYVKVVWVSKTFQNGSFKIKDNKYVCFLNYFKSYFIMRCTWNTDSFYFTQD